MKITASLLAFALAITPAIAQESIEGPMAIDKPAKRIVLNNDAIVRMTKAGLDDAIILETVRKQPGEYQTGPDDLIALKSAGVAQPVISAMMTANTGLSQRPAEVQLTPVSASVDDIGVYLFSGNDWHPMDSERVDFRDGGALKSVLTHNIVKKDLNGHVDGANSSIQLKGGDRILLYTPSGTEPTEYLLIRFRLHPDSREFRVQTGNVFHSETGADRDSVDFKAEKVATRQHEIVLPKDLKPGEYGILPPGQASPRGMAVAGKVYTFAIAK